MIVFLHNYSEKSINNGNMEKIDCFSQKKSHLTLPVDKSSMKMPKNGQIDEFLTTLSLRLNSVTRYVT